MPKMPTNLTPAEVKAFLEGGPGAELRRDFDGEVRAYDEIGEALLSPAANKRIKGRVEAQMTRLGAQVVGDAREPRLARAARQGWRIVIREDERD